MGNFNQPRQPGFKQQVQDALTQSFGYLRRQVWTNVLADVADSILDGQATSNTVITTVTSFDAQPDVARKIIVTPGGTTTDVAAGNVVITGTNIRGEVITDSLAFLANATDPTISAKAFKTITSIVFPIQDGAAATFDVGTTDALGLDRCMSGNEVILATLNGTYETTRPTVTYDADEVEKNTVDLNSNLTDNDDVVVDFIATERTNKVGSTS